MIEAVKLNLTMDETEMLQDIVHSSGIKAVLKVMDHYATQQEHTLISFVYKPGKEQELLNKKSAATGARGMFNSIKRHFEKVKGSKLL